MHTGGKAKVPPDAHERECIRLQSGKTLFVRPENLHPCSVVVAGADTPGAAVGTQPSRQHTPHYAAAAAPCDAPETPERTATPSRALREAQAAPEVDVTQVKKRDVELMFELAATREKGYKVRPITPTRAHTHTHVACERMSVSLLAVVSSHSPPPHPLTPTSLSP